MPSRSIGHTLLSKHGVTHEPTVSVTRLRKGDVVLIASDGLWSGYGRCVRERGEAVGAGEEQEGGDVSPEHARPAAGDRRDARGGHIRTPGGRGDGRLRGEGLRSAASLVLREVERRCRRATTYRSRGGDGVRMGLTVHFFFGGALCVFTKETACL